MLEEDLALCSRLRNLNHLSTDLVFEIADGTLPASRAAYLADELAALSAEFARRAGRRVVSAQPEVIDGEALP
ncbi:MAG: hypothetical protein ACRDQ7_27120 [Haloechinothrix sp.]